MPPRGRARASRGGRGSRGSRGGNRAGATSTAGLRRGRGGKHNIGLGTAITQRQARNVEELPEEDYPEIELPLMSELTERDIDMANRYIAFREHMRSIPFLEAVADVPRHLRRDNNGRDTPAAAFNVFEDQPTYQSLKHSKKRKYPMPDLKKLDIDLKMLPKELWDEADPDFLQHEPVGNTPGDGQDEDEDEDIDTDNDDDDSDSDEDESTDSDNSEAVIARELPVNNDLSDFYDSEAESFDAEAAAAAADEENDEEFGGDYNLAKYNESDDDLGGGDAEVDDRGVE